MTVAKLSKRLTKELEQAKARLEKMREDHAKERDIMRLMEDHAGERVTFLEASLDSARKFEGVDL